MLIQIANTLRRIITMIGLTALALMLFFISLSVISKTFFIPILGSVEIVEFIMIVSIMFGLSYTQHHDRHIKIGIFVDKFSIKTQNIFNVFSYFFNMIITITIAIIFVQVGLKHISDVPITSQLLDIPFYPFDFIIAIGFLMWGLESLLKLINSILIIFQTTQDERLR